MNEHALIIKDLLNFLDNLEMCSNQAGGTSKGWLKLPFEDALILMYQNEIKLTAIYNKKSKV